MHDFYSLETYQTYMVHIALLSKVKIYPKQQNIMYSTKTLVVSYRTEVSLEDFKKVFRLCGITDQMMINALIPQH